MTALDDIFFPYSHAAGREPPVPTPASDLVRLRRRDPVVPDGFVDGGWWPRSLDLSAELARLLTVMGAPGREVARALYNPAAWDPAPRALPYSGRSVALDREHGREPALLSLIDAPGGRRTDLVVIPPRTDRRVAERILALVHHGGDLRRVLGILERAGRTPPAALGPGASCDPLSAAVWETDGGRILTP